MRITERLVTYQGTGHLIGKRQAFVRFAGCSVACPIRGVCDEPLSLDHTAGIDITADEVVSWAICEVGPGGWLHITGGEPCEQPEGLLQLGVAAERAGLRIHLQTAGTHPVPIRTDWLTVSPKGQRSELCWNRNLWAQELVVIHDGSRDMADLVRLQRSTKCYDYYLCAIDLGDGDINMSSTLDMLTVLNRSGHPWDLTGQLHKHWGLP